MYCLMKASHTDYKQLVGLKVVNLKPGQFIFGRSKAASELNMKETTVWRYMKLLEKLGSISLKSNNKFTVVTIDKWGDYQSHEDDFGQQKNNKRTTKEQQMDTNKNLKNLEGEKDMNNLQNENQSPRDLIKNKFIQRRAHGFDLSPEDEHAIERLLKDEIPVENILQWTDDVFDEYQPKHRLDRIKHFKYIEVAILDKWAQSQEPSGTRKKSKKIDWENL
jgi:hypothetical protein